MISCQRMAKPRIDNAGGQKRQLKLSLFLGRWTLFVLGSCSLIGSLHIQSKLTGEVVKDKSVPLGVYNHNGTAIESKGSSLPTLVKSDTIMIDSKSNTTETQQNPIPFTEEKLIAWRKRRSRTAIYNSWFHNSSDTLKTRADANGPILDFLIAGFPKCGTTSLMRHLAVVTSMPPEEDVCTPIDNTVYYAYKNWPKRYGKDKLLKGTKCPRYMEMDELVGLGSKLPETRLVVGIRHPVLWFQSFYNMLRFRNPKTYGLENFDNFSIQGCKVGECNSYSCKRRIKVCVPRARFHLPLARMGKTARGQEEQDLLVSDIQMGKRRRNDTSKMQFPIRLDEEIRNPVFLYESSQPEEEYFWQELAKFVRIDRKDLAESHDYKVRGIGLNTKNERFLQLQKSQGMFDICNPKYDFLRKELLPMGYTLQEWLRKYFLPAARERKDIVIPNIEVFEQIITSFQHDPCDNRLVRNETDGEYYSVNN